MTDKNKCMLIVGRTASGKDTLTNRLVHSGLSVVKSYTTREKRTPDEDTHIFITKEETKNFPQNERVAETTINGIEYFATKDQLKEADIYIIDPNGIEDLIKRAPDSNFMIVYVTAKDSERKFRYISRSDNPNVKEEFKNRNASENIQFSEFENMIFGKNEKKIPSQIKDIIVVHNDYGEDSLNHYAKIIEDRYRTLEVEP